MAPGLADEFDLSLAIARQSGNPRHRRQPADAAAAAHTNQNGLGLVVARVRGEDVRSVCFACRASEQAVARRPRRFLQAGLRLGAGPAQGTCLLYTSPSPRD